MDILIQMLMVLAAMIVFITFAFVLVVLADTYEHQAWVKKPQQEGQDWNDRSWNGIR